MIIDSNLLHKSLNKNPDSGRLRRKNVSSAPSRARAKGSLPELRSAAPDVHRIPGIPGIPHPKAREGAALQKVPALHFLSGSQLAVCAAAEQQAAPFRTEGANSMCFCRRCRSSTIAWRAAPGGGPSVLCHLQQTPAPDARFGREKRALLFAGLILSDDLGFGISGFGLRFQI